MIKYVLNLWCVVSKNAWTKPFTQQDIDMSVEAVDSSNAFKHYMYAQGHDLHDVLQGDDLTGEVWMYEIMHTI
jgi:hypothetical protein